MIRRALPFALVPLGVVVTALAGTPWLRVFPSATLSVPLFGAAVLSVLLPVVVVGIGVRPLWITALVDVVGWVFVTTLVGLHRVFDVVALYDGLAHGPARVLTFALPLVGPRTLLVVPVTLCWLAGAVVGECVARAWHSVLPYATVLVVFGLGYAGSVRGVDRLATGRQSDTLVAGLLLLGLLLMRGAQAWLEQDRAAVAAQPDGVLPARGLALSATAALAVAAVVALAVQATVFTGPPVTPARRSPVARSAPLDPLAFVAGLRPHRGAGRAVFAAHFDRPGARYIALAELDRYDGTGWGFDRTFRPSGGVVPGESDPELHDRGTTVTQQYTIEAGPLDRTPWMPFVGRPERAWGLGVEVDTASGMIVPTRGLQAGQRYAVRSRNPRTGFARLGPGALLATATPPADLAVPATVSAALTAVVRSFAAETGTSQATPVAFVQAVARDLRQHYHRSGGNAATSSTATATPSGTATPSVTTRSSTTPSTTPSSTPSVASQPQAGGTGLAAVLAAILGPSRSATPEQFATLTALLARQVGVPARIVTGFRLPAAGQTTSVPSGTYKVTTGDAWTWVEIPVAGAGWTVLDPSPTAFGTQAPTDRQSARPAPTPTPTATANGLATAGRHGHAVAPPSRVPHAYGGNALVTLVIALLAALLTIVAIVAVLVTRKQRRARRRRHTGDPRHQLVAAWDESLDLLVESGLPEVAALTNAEVAGAATRRFGAQAGEQARRLGGWANAAAFRSDATVPAAQADEAWRTHWALRQSVRSGLSRTERVRAGLRYHHASRTRRATHPSGRRTPAAIAARGGRRRR